MKRLLQHLEAVIIAALLLLSAALTIANLFA